MPRKDRDAHNEYRRGWRERKRQDPEYLHRQAERKRLSRWRKTGKLPAEQYRPRSVNKLAFELLGRIVLAGESF